MLSWPLNLSFLPPKCILWDIFAGCHTELPFEPQSVHIMGYIMGFPPLPPFPGIHAEKYCWVSNFVPIDTVSVMHSMKY